MPNKNAAFISSFKTDAADFPDTHIVAAGQLDDEFRNMGRIWNVICGRNFLPDLFKKLRLRLHVYRLL